MTELLQHMLTGLLVGSVYGLVALGFVLIFKSSRIFNFAQGDILLLTVCLCWFLVTQVHLSPWASILVTFAFAALLGMAVERLALRPMVGQSLLALIMVCIAISQAFRGFSLLIVGRTGRSVELFRPEVIPSGTTRFGDVVLSDQIIWGFVIVVVLVAVFALFFRRTRTGLRMRATAEDHQLAQSKGINVNSVIALSWVIACIVAAVGGIVLGSVRGISLEMSMIGIKAIPAAFVGGLESIPGAIIAGLIIGVLEALVKGYVGLGLGEVVPFVVLILVLFVRPYGLFGLPIIERV